MSRRNLDARDLHAARLDRYLFASRPLLVPSAPRTQAIRRALVGTRSHTAAGDLLFLEAWERRASANLCDMLRAAQIRRANPALAAELRAELSRGRPLTQAERQAIHGD